MMQDFTDFDYLDKLVNKDALILKRRNIDPVLQDVKAFLRKRGVVLYGGLALNAYLSKETKIYDDDVDIPDYDGFSRNARADAEELFDELVKKGYKYLILKKAFHEGTYKIEWKFQAIVDITQIDEATFKVLNHSKVKKDGNLYIDINFIKAKGYIELAMPNSSQFRWSKIMRRLQILENETPLASRVPFKTLTEPRMYPSNVFEVIKAVKKMAVNNNVPLVGNDCIKYHLNIRRRGMISIPGFSAVEVLSADPYTFTKDVEEIMGTHKVSNYQIKENSIVMYVKGTSYSVVKVHDISTMCISATSPKNHSVYYGSIFYMIYDLYYKLFLHSGPSTNTASYKRNNATLRRVIIELLRRINRNKFTAYCVGYTKTQSAAKLERFQKKEQIVIKSKRE